MKNKRVLIVDDNDLNRKVFENIIRHNYLFDTAKNGEEAIEKLRTVRFDIILMDIQMPIMDGITALKTIKEESLTEAPIIAVSAYSEKSDRAYFLSTGFDEFIAKPIKTKELLESIHLHLQHKRPPVPVAQRSVNHEILNLDVLRQLKKYNSPKNIRTVYADFMEEAEVLIGEIKTLIDVGKYAEIGEKLHILKGNSGTLGASRMFQYAASFETKIKESNFTDILQDYLSLQNQLTIFKDYFQDQNNLTKDE